MCVTTDYLTFHESSWWVTSCSTVRYSIAAVDCTVTARLHRNTNSSQLNSQILLPVCKDLYSKSCTSITCCSLRLLFDPENGGSMFLRNIGNFLSAYAMSHPRRQHPPHLTADVQIHSVSYFSSILLCFRFSIHNDIQPIRRLSRSVTGQLPGHGGRAT
jgi:hypothetical protein